MALLGAQLVITLIMISVIQKIGYHYSFARWLLSCTGLVRYLYPTDTQLRQLANIPKKEKPKNKKSGKYTAGMNDQIGSDVFNIPRSLDVELETTKVSALDLVHLHYYTEFQWLLDFAVYSGIVYLSTEIYQYWFPNKEDFNLSMMWCCLVLGFAIKMLTSLMVQYFKGEESIGERSTCIVMGFTYLLISMMILIVDENTLEFGLETAYDSFNQSASMFLNKQDLSSSGPASKIVLKFFIAIWCGLMGALFTFPGLRIAKMHWDLLRYYSHSKAKQLLLNLSIALPFLLVILWIKPISRDYLTVRIFSGMSNPIMSPELFDSFRFIMIIFCVIVRLVLMPWYLQAYLDMARIRVEEQKKEAGRITNIDFQKKIAAVFYYLCVVSLQYIAPLIICLYFAFMYKTLGGYSWIGINTNLENNSVLEQNRNNIPLGEFDTDSIKESAQQIHLALQSVKSVFSEQVFRGLLGFATWWSCFTWFATTSVGMIYQSYFAHT